MLVHATPSTEPMSGFDGDLLTAEAFDRLQASADRDPRQCPWGLFAWGDAPAACGGGSGVLQWFATREELMAYLSDWSAPGYMTFDTEAEWLSQCDQLRSILSGWDQDPPATLARLNAELQGLLQIDWIGRFTDLSASDDSFCQRIRAAFAEDQASAAEPEDAEQAEEAWLAFLAGYGS